MHCAPSCVRAPACVWGGRFVGGSFSPDVLVSARSALSPWLIEQRRG
ncbi:hypothetical protein LG3211_4408 [Lysobacter gummosus]|nr:hypothetical protein LG3211_4408 [Lysobacter gummosus]